MNALRVRAVNDAPIRDRAYVLYWCVAARRTRWSHALDRAIAYARELRKGLVVLDALRIAYPWASVRQHSFGIEGMDDIHARFEAAGVRHFRYVERAEGEGKGLLAALAARACVVVTDDFPAFFLPRMVEAAARRLDVRVEAIDGNGLVPLRSAPKLYARAFDFRRVVWALADAPPAADPLAGPRLPPVTLPDLRWREGTVDPGTLDIPRLAPVPIRGGETAGRAALAAFVDRLGDYETLRDHPDDDATSGLSPWLHWGHLSVHEVAAATRGSTKFLDELVTWRELGFHTARHLPRFEDYDSVPDWARSSLAAHEKDEREAHYDLETLADARTGDEVWNAAQRQLLAEGRIHPRMRMLWGKRVIAWTRTPQEAYAHLIELNNRYAIDGRDPSSWAGISWCFGRYDRPWPARSIYGVVRTMTSRSMVRKSRTARYVERWS
jgi:deoxyribodipyrimidine photo-lyase